MVIESVRDVACSTVCMRYLDVVANDLGRNNLHGRGHSTRRRYLIKDYLVVLMAIQVQRLGRYAVVVCLLACSCMACSHDMHVSGPICRNLRLLRVVVSL